MRRHRAVKMAARCDSARQTSYSRRLRFASRCLSIKHRLQHQPLGAARAISRSKRPGRRRAGSMVAGWLVVPTTISCASAGGEGPWGIHCRASADHPLAQAAVHTAGYRARYRLDLCVGTAPQCLVAVIHSGQQHRGSGRAQTGPCSSASDMGGCRTAGWPRWLPARVMQSCLPAPTVAL